MNGIDPQERSAVLGNGGLPRSLTPTVQPETRCPYGTSIAHFMCDQMALGRLQAAAGARPPAAPAGVATPPRHPGGLQPEGALGRRQSKYHGHRRHRKRRADAALLHIARQVIEHKVINALATAAPRQREAKNDGIRADPPVDPEEGKEKNDGDESESDSSTGEETTASSTTSTPSSASSEEEGADREWAGLFLWVHVESWHVVGWSPLQHQPVDTKRLMKCGDIESNPGPSPERRARTRIQTSLFQANDNKTPPRRSTSGPTRGKGNRDEALTPPHTRHTGDTPDAKKQRESFTGADDVVMEEDESAGRRLNFDQVDPHQKK